MKTTISKGFGYFFLVLSLVLQVTLILISVREAAVTDFQFWIVVILAIIYLACLLMTFWQQYVSGMLLIAAGIFVGLPNLILFSGAGVIFGLPPLIAGVAFILAEVFTRAERRGVA